MPLPRWVRPAGFGLLFLLVVLAWVQDKAAGQLTGWAIGGGVAALILYGVADRLAPRPVAVVPALLMPGAIGTLTALHPANIGWFVLVVFCGFLAVAVPFIPGTLGWLAAVVTVVVLMLAVDDGGFANWMAGVTVVFWVCWAGRHRIALIERVHRAEAAAAAAATVAERQRLAGDLHDIVAHTLAVTVLHLGGARLALAHEPAEAEAGIAEAERLARHSMTELRRVVRVLAEDGADPPDPLTAPQPSAADVPALLEEYRSAGLPVSGEVTGDAARVTAGAAAGEMAGDAAGAVTGDLGTVSGTTGLVLYRLVQEALANASRHAPGQPVKVRVGVEADGAVAATISNPYAGDDPDWSRGMGLRAMTDRVRMVGGQVDAGPEGERWTVRAKLPA